MDMDIEHVHRVADIIRWQWRVQIGAKIHS